jgi:hypothetical protein
MPWRLRETQSGKETQRRIPARSGKAARNAAPTRRDGDDDGGGDDGSQQRTPDLQTPSKAELLQLVSS